VRILFSSLRGRYLIVFIVAIRLEERYKGIRSPHKIKGGVSGCVRECAEAQNKDFGASSCEVRAPSVLRLA
jgi:dissimilatory sulfite reductase (desulfoviridin) alpha/beta subunit